MCGCVEQMPVVSRSDCTQLDVQETFVFEFKVPGTDGGSGSCQDTPGFLDTYGDGCEWYEQNDPGCEQWGHICCAGGFGSPNEECCYCGGGNTVNSSNNVSAGGLSIQPGSLDIQFNSCQGVNGNNNDLRAYFKRLVNEGKQSENNFNCLREILVGMGNCASATNEFLQGRRLV